MGALEEFVGPATDSTADMLDSMLKRIAALDLDLNGLTVGTEAATGVYACTAVIAAMSGAKVYAVARDTARHGTASDAFHDTMALAEKAGVGQRIETVERLDAEILGRCDILTNTGHVRPITPWMIRAMPPSAVIALMFEAWEFRAEDFQLGVCRERNIRVAAVNERHPDVAVFPYLGPLCLKLLRDAGVELCGRRIAVVCDNPFGPYLLAGIEAAGGIPEMLGAGETLAAADRAAVVVALNPGGNPPMGSARLAEIARRSPGAIVAQFWGDIDRAAAVEIGLTVAPVTAPRPGHMGILLSALGYEPIVRLQAGGLRAAESVLRGDPIVLDGVAHLA